MSSESSGAELQTRIIHAESAEHMSAVRELLQEYWRMQGLSPCFIDFDEELNGLPGDYAPPSGGRLLLVEHEGRVAGCVALRALEPGICEMKRLYLRPQYRKQGIGRMLVEAILMEARSIGYRGMRLDTIEPKMKDAVALYQRLGFREIPPYRRNPIAGVMYMELEL
jgi:GNAT superfamily N-acetyltransferase